MPAKKENEDREGRKLKRQTLDKIRNKELRFDPLREGYLTEDDDFISQEYIEDNKLTNEIPEEKRVKRNKRPLDR